METVSADQGFDTRFLSQELRSAVVHSPQTVRDLGPIKIVPLSTVTMMLVDRLALSKVPNDFFSRLPIPKQQPVIILHTGFNVDVAFNALCAGNFICAESCDAIDVLRRENSGMRTRTAAPWIVPSSKEKFEKHDRKSAHQKGTAHGVKSHQRPVFHSQPMRRVEAELSRIAQFEFDVLILGETGTGKDVAAHEIHRRSPRSHKPFVTVSISSLCDSLIDSELFGHVRGAYSGAHESKPGKFEAAEGGTVYIPEISNLSEEMQLKLLYFMQYKKCHRIGEDPRQQERLCNVRLIMASNENLEHCVSEGRMRQDFYYRIKGLSILIPPLRERKEAIPELVRHFLRQHDHALGSRHTITKEALDWLACQSWPGNIRELEQTVRSLVATSIDQVVTREQVVQSLHGENGELMTASPCLETLTTGFPRYASFISSMQRHYLEQALEKSDGCITRAAQLSGLTPYGFRKAMARLGVQASSPR
ncbi:MAG: sigma-54-dependent Fis family transcriptional regulator [Bacteroidetes bacterium]|nr:sigma-54-dependent Fis family transcriptional regulator [Bacteroidota bacterium]